MDDSFGGETFEEDIDGDRIRRQLARVWALMVDSQWRTLDEISRITGDPPASISARLRDFRKAKHGGHTVLRQRVQPYSGLYEYRLLRASDVVAQAEGTCQTSSLTS